MLAPQELLSRYEISLPDYRPGRYYALCPRCSAKGSKQHQTDRCLGVTIDGDKVRWGCNHCSWSGPTKGDGAGNGAARDELTSHVYPDRSGIIRFRKVRNLPGRKPKCWFERPDGCGGWIRGAKGIDTSLLY